LYGSACKPITPAYPANFPAPCFESMNLPSFDASPSTVTILQNLLPLDFFIKIPGRIEDDREKAS
jgi:hypothetical protein